MGLTQMVQVIDTVTTDETRLLVQGSRAIIVPSLYETAVLAVLDARRSGRPVIWVGVDGLRDSIGDAGLTFAHPACLGRWR
jgi:hypothetical protein